MEFGGDARKKTVRPVEVRALNGYQIRLTYSDGVAGEVDLSYLVNRGVFRIWRNRAVFEKPSVTPFGGIAWGQEVELCPDALSMQITGKSVEELMPGAEGLLANARTLPFLRHSPTHVFR